MCWYFTTVLFDFHIQSKVRLWPLPTLLPSCSMKKVLKLLCACSLSRHPRKKIAVSSEGYVGDWPGQVAFPPRLSLHSGDGLTQRFGPTEIRESIELTDSAVGLFWDLVKAPTLATCPSGTRSPPWAAARIRGSPWAPRCSRPRCTPYTWAFILENF